ncbi:MAG TPA: hypothetical protein VN223_10950 [Candidatus Elarobacter sp.]|nr:hypothetical protein [Candidatus Elarobacter sp.]
MREGVPGGGIPAWALLTPVEVQTVTLNMRSFSEGRMKSATISTC